MAVGGSKNFVDGIEWVCSIIRLQDDYIIKLQALAFIDRHDEYPVVNKVFGINKVAFADAGRHVVDMGADLVEDGLLVFVVHPFRLHEL